jgi:hypothetical protein
MNGVGMGELRWRGYMKPPVPMHPAGFMRGLQTKLIDIRKTRD